MQVDKLATATDQRKAAMYLGLRRATTDIALGHCQEFSSFELPAEPDWREHLSSLCWPRLKAPAYLDVLRTEE